MEEVEEALPVDPEEGDENEELPVNPEDGDTGDVEPEEETLPGESTDSDEESLPVTGSAYNPFGLMFVLLGAVLLIVNKRKGLNN